MAGTENTQTVHKSYVFLVPIAKWLSAILVLAVLLGSASYCLADTPNYYYDKSGRLTRVVNGTEGADYVYDDVGNLQTITRTAISTSPPVLQSINPNLLPKGAVSWVHIYGQNLFSTKSISTGNSSVKVNYFTASDSEIQAEITVPSDAAVGMVTLNVTTAFGSDSINASVVSSAISLSPARLTMPAGSSTTLSVTVSPAPTGALSMLLKSSDPTIAALQSDKVTIPSGATAQTTTVISGSAGETLITSGDASTYALIIGKDIPASAPGVSVYIEQPNGDAVSMASFVSVYRDSQSGPGIITSSLISIQRGMPAKIQRTDQPYGTIQAAYNAAATGDTILIMSAELTESLSCDRGVSVVLDGGYDVDYTSNTGVTTIKGDLTISNGDVTVSNLAIQ